MTKGPYAKEKKKNYTFFWNGQSKHERRKHGFAIWKSLPHRIQNPTGNERISTLVFDASTSPVTIVNVYAPTFISEKAVKVLWGTLHWWLQWSSWQRSLGPLASDTLELVSWMRMDYYMNYVPSMVCVSQTPFSGSSQHTSFLGGIPILNICINWIWFCLQDQTWLILKTRGHITVPIVTQIMN